MTATGHLPPDSGGNGPSRPGTPSLKVPPVGSPAQQLSETTTPGRGAQVSFITGA